MTFINPLALLRAATPTAVPKPAKFKQPPLLTVGEAAEFLGVCTKTVRRLITAQTLLSHRVGRSIRIADADLRAYLAAHRS